MSGFADHAANDINDDKKRIGRKQKGINVEKRQHIEMIDIAKAITIFCVIPGALHKILCKSKSI